MNSSTEQQHAFINPDPSSTADIASLAYSLWEQSGHPEHSRDDGQLWETYFWLAAERQLRLRVAEVGEHAFGPTGEHRSDNVTSKAASRVH